MAAKVDFTEAKRRVLELYPEIDILEYDSINKQAKFLCNDCGRIWNCRACLIVNGRSSCSCKKSSKKKFHPISKEEVSMILDDKNILLLSEFPTSEFQKIEVKFACGHSKKLTVRMIIDGAGCGTCRSLNFYTNKWTEDKIKNLLSENGLIFVGFEGEYIDGSSKVTYMCQDGHATTRDVKNVVKFPTCKQCKIISRGKMQSGSGSSSWKGGVSKIWVAARNRLDPWLDRSLKSAEYTCFITGQRNVPIDVHHITSFNIILKQVMNEFGFDENYYEKSYAECDGERFLARVVEVNNSYGLGVVLRKDIHILYHKTYGHGNNTPSQFTEFLSRIKSGEIIISN